MSGDISEWVQDIHCGDAADTLSQMPENSVHCVMTSPPYYGLRDYSADGQIGLEDSLDEYISELVGVFREVRRVLRPDGTWWLNLGDSFAGSGRGQCDGDDDDVPEAYAPDAGELGDRDTDLRRKNKMLVPYRVAIALQEAGWICRNDATWYKPNPMPNPVKDRLNTQTERVFLLAKSEEYFFDLDSIRAPHSEVSLRRMENEFNHTPRGHPGGHTEDLDPENFCHPSGKNPGDVMEVTTQPFPEAHFAVFPPDLIRDPMKAGTPEQVCAECGTPYERVVKRVTDPENRSGRPPRTKRPGVLAVVMRRVPSPLSCNSCENSRTPRISLWGVET